MRQVRQLPALVMLSILVAGGGGCGRKHVERVHDLAFSPDGKSVASAGDDGVVMVWDASTGMASVQPGKSVMVFSVAFSPDGKSLASECWDGKRGIVELRDPVSGALRAAFGEHPFQGRALRYSPDGSLLALGGRSVTIWDASGRQVRQSFKEAGGPVAFSPDGSTLATDGFNSTIKLWDVHNGQERTLLKEYEGAISSLSFSPDGKLLALASNQMIVTFEQLKSTGHPPGEVKVWDVATGLVKLEFVGTSRVWAVAFAPDGATLAAGQENGEILFRDVATGTLRGTARANRGGVRALAYSPDGKTLAAGGEDGTVLMLDPF